MEMPEGWKNLKEMNRHLGTAEALLLMREMAEALNAVEKRMKIWHDISNAKRLGEPVYQQEYLDIKKLNEKFKEWK